MCEFFQSLDTRLINGARNCIRLASFYLLVALTAGSSNAATPPILTLNDPTETPYTTKAGDGFFDLIAREAFRRAGLQLKLIKLPPERGLINANAGIEDGDLSRIAGLEKTYSNLIRVPEKMIDMDFVALARKPSPATASWAALEPIPVGHIKGWKIFESNLRPATQVITTDDPEQLLTLLGKDRIDVALYDRWMGLALAHQMAIKGVHVVEPPLATREMFIYLHQRHADKVPAIAAALKALKADGTYTRLCREKFGSLAKTVAQCDVK